MNKNIKLFIIFFLLILCGLAVVFGKEVLNYQSDLSETQEENNHLESRPDPSYSEEVYIIDGTIIQLGDNYLVCKAIVQQSQSILPEEGGFEKEDVLVNIVEETEIFQLRTTEQETSLESFEKIIFNFEDLKVDDHIIITSEENIKGKEEFTAQKIQIIRGDVVSPVPDE
jgi:hypothetical protein